MEGIITTLVVIAIIVAAVCIIVAIVKSKINKTTQKYLGMGASEAANFIKKGLQEEATLPMSIIDLTAAYKPAIARDFPETGYAGLEAIAKNTIVAVFNAIEAADLSLLSASYISQKLKQQVENIINDNISRNTKPRFDNVKFHKIAVSDYKNKQSAVEAVFQFSLQYVGEAAQKNSQIIPVQAAYSVTLGYDQNQHLKTTSIVFGSNCPNCGAPISAIGQTKVCQYCGSGLTAISDRVWQAISFAKIK